MKFWARVSIVVIMSLFVVSTVYASAFKDIHPQNKNSIDINWAVERGVIQGFKDGTFRPYDPVLESQFAMMTSRYIGKPASSPNGAYDVLQRQGVSLVGYRKTTARSQPIPRMEVARVFYQLSHPNVNARNIKENDIIDWMYSSGMTRGNGRHPNRYVDFGKTDQLTRYQATAFYHRYDAKSLYKGDEAKPVAPEDVNGSNEQPSKPVKPEPKPEPKPVVNGHGINGIELGDQEDVAKRLLGKEQKAYTSGYGGKWHIYHKQYRNFHMVNFNQGKVTALFTRNANYESRFGIKIGDSKTSVIDKLDKEIKTYVDFSNKIRFDDRGVTVTYYFDKYSSDRLVGVLIDEKSIYKQGYATVSSDSEYILAELTNAERMARNLQPVRYDERVAAVARRHTRDMAAQRYFSHTSKDGRSLGDRMTQGGVPWSSVGENIAMRYHEEFSAHFGWLNSAGHRVNLLDPNWQYVGLGVHQADSGDVYYTQNFMK